MRPRGRSRYEQMLGYLVRLMRRHDMPWAKGKAWTIAAYRTKFSSDGAYLELADVLEKDARAVLKQEAADRARQTRGRSENAIALPAALHVRVDGHARASDDWKHQVAETWLYRGSGGASQRTPPLIAAPAPAPISARVVTKANRVNLPDCQPDEPEDTVTVTPGHLLLPDEVAELAEVINRRRL